MALSVGLLGLAVAALTFGVLAGANVQWTEIAGYELVGLSYIVAGTIAWLRRPDNLIGPAILVTGITSFIPVFVRVPIPAVTSAAFAFAWVTNVFAAFILLAYPSGRLFSRPGTRLLFSSWPGGPVKRGDLWIIDLDETDLTRVTDTPAQYWGTSWQPQD